MHVCVCVRACICVRWVGGIADSGERCRRKRKGKHCWQACPAFPRVYMDLDTCQASMVRDNEVSIMVGGVALSFSSLSIGFGRLSDCGF